jgi:hypothetical protein
MLQSCLRFAAGTAVGALLLAGGIAGCSSMSTNHVDCNVVRLQAQSGRSNSEIASAIGASEADVASCHATGVIPGGSMESGTPPSGAETGAAPSGDTGAAAPSGDTSAAPSGGAAPAGGDSGAAPSGGDSGAGGKPPM